MEPLIETKTRRTFGMVAIEHGRKVLHATDRLGSFVMEPNGLEPFAVGNRVVVTTVETFTYSEGVKRERSCTMTLEQTVRLAQ